MFRFSNSHLLSNLECCVSSVIDRSFHATLQIHSNTVQELKDTLEVALELYCKVFSSNSVFDLTPEQNLAQTFLSFPSYLQLSQEMRHIAEDETQRLFAKEIRPSL